MIEAINKDVLFFHGSRYPELTKNILDLMECLRKQDTFYQEEAEGILAALLPGIARVQIKNKENAKEEQTGKLPAGASQLPDSLGIRLVVIIDNKMYEFVHMARPFSGTIKT